MLIGFFLIFLSVNTYAAGLSMASLTMKNILGTPPKSGDSQVFKKALQPINFHFPRDHLVHQEYKTEWWYFTGNLRDITSEREFSYQFTLFRFALHPYENKRLFDNRIGNHKNLKSNKNSSWRSDNVYMAHIALTDIKENTFYRQERFSRDGSQLAGADKKADGTLSFWLNNWRATSMTAEKLFPLQLMVKSDEFTLDLQLKATKALVLQGQQGLSQKSLQHASYYYSYPRLASQGSLMIKNKKYQVAGQSWFDREWATSSLAEDQQGWDWFSIHLDDGSDLMLYQMRQKKGGKGPYSSGSISDHLGNSKTLVANQFQVNALEFWQSPVSGIRYPIKWQVVIPEMKIKLTVQTRVKHQEWSKAEGFSFDYWEGGITITGSKNQQTVSGSGYLEMTGYQ